MLMANPILFDGTTTREIKKISEKRRITDVIAPEHNKRHHDHENKMKNEEKILIEQTISHCEGFISKFKTSAKGDWVDSAISELEDISDHLRKIMD